MPLRKKDFEAGSKLGEAAVKGAVESYFGGPLSREDRAAKAAAEELPSFEELPEDEQAARFYEVESLVAEHRDLVKTLQRKPEKKARPTFAVKMVNGRPLRVPVTTGEDAQESIHAREAAEERLLEVKKQLKTLGMQPGLKEAYEAKAQRLWFQMRVARLVEEERMRLEELESEREAMGASSRKGWAGSAVGKDRERLKEIDEEAKEIRRKLHVLETHENGDLIERFLQLRKYTEAVEKGRIVEIPSVQKLVDEGLEAMARGTPYMLAGQLGSGKTEVARHMAKLHMLKNGIGYDPATEDPDEAYSRLEPEMFSGAEEASVYDLVGKLKLTGRAVDANLAAKQAIKLSDALDAKGIKIPKEEAAKLLLGQANVTETVFAYGPLGRALRDDKPVIIDEINLMPPEVVARINDVLVRKIGDTFRLQENGEETFTRGPGFAVLSTLNLGHQYGGIREFNAAFASRWVGREVDYPSAAEDFDLIIASLNRKDRTRLPPNFPPEAYEQLIDLALVTREIQELFSGQTEGQRFMALSRSAGAEKAQLEKVVVSTRDLMRKIVEPFKASDFRVPLDEIIAKNILAPAGIQSKDDQAFLTELFLRRGFFKDWTARQFSAEGVKSVSQKDIDALQTARQSDEYKAANKAYEELLGEAKKNAGEIRSGLMVGNLEIAVRKERERV